MDAYLEPPAHETVAPLATIDADLRLLPIIRSGTASVDDALSHVRERRENALAELNMAEDALRSALADASDEPIPDDADLSEAIDIYSHGIAPQKARTHAPADPALIELRLAHACTALLADGEKALTNVADNVDNELCALSRIAAAAGDAQQRAALGDQLSEKTAAVLSERRDTFFESLCKKYTDALCTALKEVAWPPQELQNPEHRGEPGHVSLWDDRVKVAWSDLCSLQFGAAALELVEAPTAVHHAGALTRDEAPKAAPGSDDYVPLFAVGVLMEPLLLRFRFHFDSNRTTNRLDKPEWFLSNMLALIQLNSFLFEPARDMWSRGGYVCELTRFRPQGRRSCVIDAPAELLHSMLVPLRLKLHASMELLGSQPALLAHTIFQCLAFDTDLRAAYRPAQDSVQLADEMLGNDALFQRWLDGEREFATRRFEDVVDAPGAWSLIQAETLTEHGETDMSEADCTGHITTRAAATLITVLIGVTERYQPLVSLEQRSAFIIRVQHPLLFQFYDRLARHLDAFENMSSAFSRALPGEITSLSTGAGSDIVRGVNGIKRVAKAYVSSDYVYQQLVGWSESSFFLHMADELHERPRGSLLRRLMYPSKETDIDSASLVAILHKGLQRGASAAATLRPLGKSSSPVTLAHEQEEGEPISVWERYVSRYADISARSKRGIERLVVSEVLDLLKPYFLRPWDSDESREPQQEGEDGEESIKSPIASEAPCKELVPALARFASLMTELVQTLPATLLLPIYRQIASSLSSAIVDRVLLPGARMPQKFTPNQAKQFFVDVHNGWLHVVRELDGHPRVVSRRKKHEQTGIGRKPEAQWRALIEAAESVNK